MNNSSDTVLTTKSCFSSRIHLPLRSVWQQVKAIRRNNGQVMAQFVPGSNEKHGIEMKIKELNPVEERNFLCKL